MFDPGYWTIFANQCGTKVKPDVYVPSFSGHFGELQRSSLRVVCGSREAGWNKQIMTTIHMFGVKWAESLKNIWGTAPPCRLSCVMKWDYPVKHSWCKLWAATPETTCSTWQSALTGLYFITWTKSQNHQVFLDCDVETPSNSVLWPRVNLHELKMKCQILRWQNETFSFIHYHWIKTLSGLMMDSKEKKRCKETLVRLNHAASLQFDLNKRHFNVWHSS